ncbi:hypothetical protein SUGI_0500340 [Cryptomeria japonica]|nr:hypothetical protein SUGI_0500340 [Cryptomeria japonica]
MAASVAQIQHKRARENITECYKGEYENDQNLQKRSRNGLLSDFFSTDDCDGEAVEDDLVLQVMKNLEEEINGTSETGKNSRLTSEAGERNSSYDDLGNATDDQLGISPRPPLSGEENDNEGISNKFWSDLFESPSSATGQSVDVLQPFLSHCYSYNYRDCADYSTLLLSEDQQDWIQEAFTDLASQGFPTLL